MDSSRVRPYTRIKDPTFTLARLFHTGSSRGTANPDADTTSGRETAVETALALRGQP